jgi:hypothetical protein
MAIALELLQGIVTGVIAALLYDVAKAAIRRVRANRK